MFHIYEGFHLVETYHKMRHQRKYHPEDSTKRVVKIAIVALVTLLLWNIPTEWFGIQNLTVMVRYSEPDSYPAARDCHLCLCHIDVDSRSGQFMGHIDCHYGLDVAILY